MNKVKKIVIGIIILIAVAFMTVFIPKLYATTKIVEGIFTDNNGVRWAYKYDSSVEDSIVSIAFFDKPDSVTKVKIPDVSNMINGDGNRIIPSAHSNMQVVARFDITGETPNESNTIISEINIERANNIESLFPMISLGQETKIILPETLFTLQSEVFKDAKIDIVNLDNATYIGESCFENTTFKNPVIELSQLSAPLKNKSFYQSNIQSIVLNFTSNGVVCQQAFEGCTQLQSIQLNNVGTILDNAFKDCTNLRMDFVVPESIRHIGSYAFSGSGIVSVKLNSQLQVLGDYSFSACPNLTSVDLGLFKNIVEDGPGGWSFAENPELQQVNLGVIPRTSAFMFQNCSKLTGEGINFGLCNTISYRTFYNDQAITNLKLGDSVVSVQNEAFENCSINNLDLNKVQELKYRAFANNKLTELYMPNSIVKLNDGHVFQDNLELKKVTIAYDTMSSGITCDFNSMIGYTGYNREGNNIEEIILEAPLTNEEDINQVNKQKLRMFSETISRPQVTLKVKVPNEYYHEFTSNDGVYRAQLRDSALEDCTFSLNNSKELKPSMYLTAEATNGQDTKEIYTSIGDFDETYDLYSFSGTNNTESGSNNRNYRVTSDSNASIIGWTTFNNFSKTNLAQGTYITKFSMPDWKDTGYNIQEDSMYLHIKIDNFKSTQIASNYLNVTIQNEEIQNSFELSESNIETSKDGIFQFNISTERATLKGPYTIDFSNLGNLTDKKIYDAETNELITLTNNKFESETKRDFYIKFDTEQELIEFYNDVITNDKYIEIQGKGYVNEVEYEKQKYSEIASYNKKDYEENYGNADSYENIVRPKYFYGVPNLKKVTIGEGYEFIGSDAFLPNGVYIDNATLEEINLPSTLKGIGTNAFQEALEEKNILTIKLPKHIEYIGQGAFLKDSGFQEYVDLPNLRYIGEAAFYQSNISGIKLNDKLIDCGASFILECRNLKEIIVDCDFFALETVAKEGKAFFQQIYTSNYNNPQFDRIVFTEKVKTLPKYDGYLYGSFYKIIANTVDISKCGWTKLGMSCFQEANIETLLLPENLEIINQNAFYNATIKNQITLPDSIKEIKSDAFNCAKLSAKQLPSKLERIERGAFYGCKICENPILPKTVTFIGQGAFMSDVTKTPIEPIKYGTVTFDCDLPIDKLEDRNGQIHAVFWGSTIEKVIFTENVKQLPSTNMDKEENYKAEFYNLKIKEAQFDGLEILPDKAFIHDEELETIVFTKDTALTEIGELSFYGCKKLKNVSLPENNSNTIKLGYSAFRDTGLESVGDSTSKFDLTKCKFNIEEGFTFGECKNLKTVFIPNGFNNNIVTKFMFWNCENLEQANIDYEIQTMEAHVFSGDSKLDKIFIWGNTEIKEKNPDEIPDPNYTLEYNPSKYTIPSNTNIYSYSKYQAKDWDTSHAEQRRNEEYKTNGKFYPLDEVLYLTSNHPEITVKVGSKDFDKTGLVVYGLRRDGVVIESSDWSTLTNHYLRNSSQEFKNIKIQEGKEIYDTIVPIKKVEMSTTNYSSLKTDYDSKNLKLGKRDVKISYQDGPTNNILTTNIDINVISETVSKRIVTVTGKLQYKDGTPIANKIIVLSNKNDTQTTKTDKEGNYQFDNIVSGDYILEIKENETTVLATCNLTVKENEDKTKEDKINITNAGNYEVDTKISDDVFHINGVLPKDDKKRNYTVTFLDWDNKTINTQTVESGQAATEPKRPTRKGYDFTGWDKDFTNIIEDTIVTAQYKKKTFKVTFKDYNGTILKEEVVKYQEAATPPKNPTRKEYNFTGWDKDFTNIVADTIVTAVYEKIPQNIKAKVDNTIANKIIVNCGKEIIIEVLIVLVLGVGIVAKIKYNKIDKK